MVKLPSNSTGGVESDVLYDTRDTLSVFPVADAFYRTGSDLVLFQFTISEQHSPSYSNLASLERCMAKYFGTVKSNCGVDYRNFAQCAIKINRVVAKFRIDEGFKTSPCGDSRALNKSGTRQSEAYGC